MDEIEHLVRHQDGVIARWQTVDLGLSQVDIAKRLRRGSWVTLHPGIYLTHNGHPTWLERAWGGVLHAWPAALSHGSAIRATEGPGWRQADESVIHVAINRQRKVAAVPGVVIHRAAGFKHRIQWNLAPPRVRYADATLDLAAAARSDLDAVAVLANACGGRRTTANRLLETLDQRARTTRRAWLTEVLRDVADGTHSVLEHGYLTRVVEPHGLPRGSRQARHEGAGVVAHADVEHRDYGVRIELDGRLFHTDPSARDSDLDRDLAAAAELSTTTLRVGYAQVYDRPCLTAQRIAAVLRRGGWLGEAAACEECQLPISLGA